MRKHHVFLIVAVVVVVGFLVEKFLYGRSSIPSNLSEQPTTGDPTTPLAGYY